MVVVWNYNSISPVELNNDNVLSLVITADKLIIIWAGGGSGGGVIVLIIFVHYFVW